MNDAIWPETIMWCLSMLKYIGFEIEKEVPNHHTNNPRISTDTSELWKDLYVMWSAKVGDPYPQKLFFGRSPDMNKEKFLKLFQGGHNFSNAVGSVPWTTTGHAGVFSTRFRNLQYGASFFGDVGRGKNNQVYLDTGWIATYEEGNYSNMALIEFEMGSGLSAEDYGLMGRNPEMVITYGENAYSRWIQKSGKVIIPDSINNWAI